MPQEVYKSPIVHWRVTNLTNLSKLANPKMSEVHSQVSAVC